MAMSPNPVDRRPPSAAGSTSVTMTRNGWRTDIRMLSHIARSGVSRPTAIAGTV